MGGISTATIIEWQFPGGGIVAVLVGVFIGIVIGMMIRRRKRRGPPNQ